MASKLYRIRSVLDFQRREQINAQSTSKSGFWPWIGKATRSTLTKRDANKFLFYCFLEYQMPQGAARNKTISFVDDYLGDPADVWSAVATYRPSSWEQLAQSRDTRLHRYSRAHMKLWNVARIMQNHFAGDARLLWRDRSSMNTRERLTTTLTMGPQLARMTVLGLLENGFVKGDGLVKADIHVRRVLGRMWQENMFGIDEIHRVDSLISQLSPSDGWKLDLPLYLIGKNHCKASRPHCSECPASQVCAYARSR